LRKYLIHNKFTRVHGKKPDTILKGDQRSFHLIAKVPMAPSLIFFSLNGGRLGWRMVLWIKFLKAFTTQRSFHLIAIVHMTPKLNKTVEI
jgi:hypothetical protein